jgi:hypothetical protein
MESLFFVRLWRRDRWLWWLVVVYCGVSGVMHLAGAQVSPFYLWGMYSQRVEPQMRYEGLEIRDERGEMVPFTRLPHSTMHMITVPTEYWLAMEAAHGKAPLTVWMREKGYDGMFAPYEAQLTNDSVDMAGYMGWLKGYIGRATGKLPTRLEVARCGYAYEAETGALLQTDKQVVWYE